MTAMTAIAADSRQMPARRLETAAERTIPKTTPSAVEMREVDDEVHHRLVRRGASAQDDAGEREREHGAGRVVERRLGDDRLRDLRAEPEPLEERDEDGGIGRSEHGADQKAGREGKAENSSRHDPVTSAVRTTPGMTSRASPTATRLRMRSES